MKTVKITFLPTKSKSPMFGLGGRVFVDEAANYGAVTELHDSEYQNDLLNRIASESPTFAKLVADSLQYLDEYKDNHLPTWLGTFTDGRPRTQVQLLLTQQDKFWIDED